MIQSDDDNNNDNNKKIYDVAKNYINVQEFVCGWGASFINISVTYPVYKIMFRQVKKTYFFAYSMNTKEKLHFFVNISDVAWRRNEISHQ